MDYTVERLNDEVRELRADVRKLREERRLRERVAVSRAVAAVWCMVGIWAVVLLVVIAQHA